MNNFFGFFRKSELFIDLSIRTKVMVKRENQNQSLSI